MEPAQDDTLQLLSTQCFFFFRSTAQNAKLLYPVSHPNIEYPKNYSSENLNILILVTKQQQPTPVFTRNYLVAKRAVKTRSGPH
jgi:hypothetical protein